MPLVDTGCCQLCTKPFQAGQRVRGVFTNPRFGAPPRAMLMNVERFAHLACADPYLTGVLLMPDKAPLEPRVPGDTCVRCRKKFAPGDRFDIAYIVLAATRENGHAGVRANAEFELAHVLCEDPSLSGRLLDRVL